MAPERKVIERSVYDWLDLIRKKPALYLGERSLERLFVLLVGINFGLGTVGMILKDEEDFHRFHDWVAKWLGFYESTSGWHNMIRSKCANEAEALDKFYVLLDEFRIETGSATAR